MLDSLIALIAPHRCLSCQRQGALVCKDCRGRLARRRRSSCFRCNRFTSRFQVCKNCRRHVQLGGVVVGAHYQGAIKELITRLKYQHMWAGGRLGAELLTPLLDANQFDLVTAVPTASSRLRSRGYNQATLIARPLARQLRLPYRSLLIRSGQSRQVGLDRAGRLEQMRGVMSVLRPETVRGQRILVIDDVLTTGASLEEAGRALRQAGAKSVWGAVVAKH